MVWKVVLYWKQQFFTQLFVIWSTLYSLRLGDIFLHICFPQLQIIKPHRLTYYLQLTWNSLAAMTIISFYEVDFSYDRNYLVQVLGDSQKNLQSIICRHLTDKSVNRVESVFSFFANERFLDVIFKRDSEYREALGRVVNDLNKGIENGDLWTSCF